MNLVLASRQPDPASCERWDRAPRSSPRCGPPDAVIDHYEAPAQARQGETAVDLFARVRARLLAYDIFPPGVVRATICPSGRISAGATIVQHIMLGPLALEAAVRVIDVWDRVCSDAADEPGGVRAAGFRYVTLQGHPECGIASFEVRAGPDGEVTVLLDARSRPGTWLTRLGRPFARRFQQAVTRAALRRLTETGKS
jgi:uncharacterized protein (UPF0548 family)